MIIEEFWRSVLARVLVLPAVLVSTSCAAQTGLRDQIVYSVEDVSTQEEVIVRFTSGMREDICIDLSSWPDSKGRISNAQNVFLQVEKQLFPLQDMGHYDCFDFNDEGICSHRLPPGETLAGRIPYENFSLPASLRNKGKTLRYQPYYYLSDNECRPVDERAGRTHTQIEIQPEIVMEADASVSLIIADANQRYSHAGYSFSDHSMQVRRQGSAIYIDYMYDDGPARGGAGGDPCCVSVTYEYKAGNFVRMYFAR